MEPRKLAVAIVALSFAAVAGARADKASSPSASSGQAYSTSPSSSAGQGASGPASAATLAMNDESTVRSAQQALKNKGYDPGAADGKLGPQTESALKQFQQAQGLTQSGELDQKTMSALGVSQGGSTSTGSSTSTPGAASKSSAPRQGMSSSGSSSGAMK